MAKEKQFSRVRLVYPFWWDKWLGLAGIEDQGVLKHWLRGELKKLVDSSRLQHREVGAAQKREEISRKAYERWRREKAQMPWYHRPGAVHFTFASDGYVGASDLDQAGLEAGFIRDDGVFVSASRHCPAVVAEGLGRWILLTHPPCFPAPKIAVFARLQRVSVQRAGVPESEVDRLLIASGLSL